MNINVMVDLETTGVEPGCCILSIALVPFLVPAPLDNFYETISHQKSLEAGFTDDPETIAWWNRQRKDIAEEAFSGFRSPQSVLESVSFYLRQLGEPKEIHLWGNGKDFDNAILTKYFKQIGIKLPWHYRNNHCYRDLANMYPSIAKGEVEGAHNALNDALAQAKHAERLFEMASRGIPPYLPK